MKKVFIAFLFVSLALFVSGQVTYNDSRENLLASMQRNKNFREHIAKEKITVMQAFAYKNTNQKGTLEYESHYDNRGNSVDWVTYRHGKIKNQRETKYDDNNRVISSTFTKGNGKLKNMFANTYDNAGNQIEQDIYMHNPKAITTKTIKTYNNRNDITESKEYNRKGNLISRIEYTYYEDGSKKQTMEYSGKGKIEKVWNFDCNPVGRLQAAKFKDTDKVCIHYETDKDGKPIKVKEEYSGSGVLGMSVRNVLKYDKDNNWIDAAYYKFNGKQINHWSATYTSEGKIMEYVIYKTGTTLPKFRNTYTYNANGDMTEMAVYKESAPLSTVKYVYNTAALPPAK